MVILVHQKISVFHFLEKTGSLLNNINNMKVQMANEIQTHERLIKNTFETTKSHRYFFIIFLSIVCFNLLNSSNQSLYILSILFIALIISNIVFLITDSLFFKSIADFPVEIISKLLDLSGTLLLSIFYFSILTTFSYLKKNTKNYSFLNKMWVDVETNQIDFENGF